MKGKWIIRGIGFTILVAIGITAFGFVFMHLWNWLMPAIFGLGEITWFQGIGLLILGKMLFGGWRSKWGHGHCGGGYCGGGYGYRGGWKNKWKEKMMNMSPEEREKFKMKMKEKCGMSFEDDEPKQEA